MTKTEITEEGLGGRLFQSYSAYKWGKLVGSKTLWVITYVDIQLMMIGQREPTLSVGG